MSYAFADSLESWSNVKNKNIKTKPGSNKLKEIMLLPLAPFFFPSPRRKQEQQQKASRGSRDDRNILFLYLVKNSNNNMKKKQNKEVNKNRS